MTTDKMTSPKKPTMGRVISPRWQHMSFLTSLLLRRRANIYLRIWHNCERILEIGVRLEHPLHQRDQEILH